MGQITGVAPQKPYEAHNVKVEFEIVDTLFPLSLDRRFLCEGERGGFSRQATVEVTRATNGYALVVTQPVSVKTIDELKQLVTEEPGQWQLSQDVFGADSNLVFGAYTTLDESNLQVLAGMNLASNSALCLQQYRQPQTHRGVVGWTAIITTKFSSPATTPPDMRAVESPPVSDQLQAMILQVQQALPNVLALTNQNLPPCWTTPRTPRRISMLLSLRRGRC